MWSSSILDTQSWAGHKQSKKNIRTRNTRKIKQEAKAGKELTMMPPREAMAMGTASLGLWTLSIVITAVGKTLMKWQKQEISTLKS